MLMEKENITPEYVQQVDVEPDFWQFLIGLRADDLISELVQNDIDAGASKTKITFEEDGFVCEGDGASIDSDGWKRLSFLKGAGNKAPRKINSIGVKNHGLKACFTIGDEIVIKSDGKATRQTLYQDGYDQKPSPAAYKYPVTDDNAPKQGCRVDVPYREQELNVETGEALDFPAVSVDKIEKLFLEACQSAPTRFIGVINPNKRSRFILELHHYKLGSVIFDFRIGKKRVFQRYSTIFIRTCKVAVSAASSLNVKGLKENCCLFSVQLPAGFNKEIPSFYSLKKRKFTTEISWATTLKGKPVFSLGRRRYPIEYAGDGDKVFTRTCFNHSAPYVSDVERHGIAGAELNAYIDDACRSKMIAILRYEIMPKYGAPSLALLFVPQYLKKEFLKVAVEHLVVIGGLPLAPKKTGAKKSLQFGPKILAGKKKRVVLPLLQDQHVVNPLLSLLCPKNEDQIHPKVPEQILDILAGNENTDLITHITFDESDAIDRFIGWEARHFPWSSSKERQKCFSDPDYAVLYLDLIFKYCLKYLKRNEQIEQKILNNALLPSTSRKHVAIGKLIAGKDIPPKLPVENIPPIIHKKLASHQIFRKKRWHLKKYTFKDFLIDLEESMVSEKIKREFWQWLVRNWKKVPQRAWSSMALLPIWPGNDGAYYPLGSLCIPRKQAVARILAKHVVEPHSSVSNISPVKKAQKGNLKLRRDPEFAEIFSYVSDRLALFPTDKCLTETECKKFAEFEGDVAVLARFAVCKDYLQRLGKTIYALNKNGYLCPVNELVKINSDLKNVDLTQSFLLKRKESILINLLGWLAKNKPTSDQILQTLEDDPFNKNALIHRLKLYVEIANIEGLKDFTGKIREIKCIPIDGEFCKPEEIAFRSTRGDYWGEWKKPFSKKGLNANIQKIYRKVGVMSGTPTQETSLLFFKWLSTQTSKVISSHLNLVIRHIGHNQSKTIEWCRQYTDVPFIPYRIEGKIALASLAEAKTVQFRLLIPDFKELQEVIDSNNPANIKLVIPSVKSVRNPITAVLIQLGVKSLTDKVNMPYKVVGENISDCPNYLTLYHEKLCSRRTSRELRKRLDELGLYNSTLKNRWKSKLKNIKNIRLARKIVASYKLYNRKHIVIVEFAFERETGTIWLKSGSKVSLEEKFFKVVADLIFESSEKYTPIVLQRALDLDFSDEKDVGGRSPVYEDFDSEIDEDADVDSTDIMETKETHSPIEQDIEMNTPSPNSIPEHSGSGTTKGNAGTTGRKERGTSNSGSTGKKRAPVRLEKEQIKNLKENQYAWHCQVCLAERKPEELAPLTSYAGYSNNRGKIMDACHIDQVHGGGARDANNILILCHYHHHFYGDSLSRQDVLEALQSRTEKKVIRFIVHKETKTAVKLIKGINVKIRVPLTGDKVSCFFTEQHASHWLKEI